MVEDYRNCQSTRRGCFFSHTLSNEYQAPSHRSDLRPLSFRFMPLIENVLRMKTPLKYDTRIRLVNSFNCTLIVARQHFYHSFSVFFFFAATPCSCTNRVRACICTERDTVRDPVPSRDCDVAVLRADVARLCCRLLFSILTAPPIKDPSAPNISRNNAPPCVY